MKKTVTKKNTTKKKKKGSFSDTLRAFLLVLAIVAVSAAVSGTVILVYSRVNQPALTEETVETAVSDNAVTERNNTIIDDSRKMPDIEVFVSTQSAQDAATSPPPRTPSVTNTPPPATRPAPPSRRQAPAAATPPAAITSAPAASTVPAATSAAVVPKRVEGTLVFVIDDAGNNLRELEPFLRIPGPLTIAVLPGLPNSAEAARRIRAAGKEVILHQPMEALGGQNPGPGAIYSGMSADEIRAVLARNIAEIGPVTGMNNHQGSKITMDRAAMETILAFCAENGIYFLDSRTTADSVAAAVARQIGIEIAERNVFIDNEQSKEAMQRYMSTGLLRAQRSGLAVMIGHTWSPALAPLLAEQFPVLMEQGYTIKTAYDIIKAR